MVWWMVAAAMMSVPQEMPATPAAACPTPPAPLPAEYVGWSPKGAVAAGATADAAAGVTVGKGARATLLPTDRTHFAAVMKHSGTPRQFGGNLAFVATGAGRYRVALAAPAWIDVVSGKTPTATLPSVAHGRGPDCSGIRKTVDFDLVPGAYLLQIAGSDAATLDVMVASVAAP